MGLFSMKLCNLAQQIGEMLEDHMVHSDSPNKAEGHPETNDPTLCLQRMVILTAFQAGEQVGAKTRKTSGAEWRSPAAYRGEPNASLQRFSVALIKGLFNSLESQRSLT